MKPWEIDRFTFNELAAYIEGKQEQERNEHRRTRMIFWAILQVNTKKRLKPEKIYPIQGERDRQLRSGISKEQYLETLKKYNLKPMKRG